MFNVKGIVSVSIFPCNNYISAPLITSFSIIAHIVTHIILKIT